MRIFILYRCFIHVHDLYIYIKLSMYGRVDIYVLSTYWALNIIPFQKSLNKFFQIVLVS